MTNLEKLVKVDAELKAIGREIRDAEQKYIAPLCAKQHEAGERANALWQEVLKEYGPGAAQDALRAAKGEQ